MESTTSTDPSLASLSSLPTELLQEIVEYLDNPTLLAFSLTCKEVHYLALHSFFNKNDIREPGEGWLVAYKTPIETLPAVRAALFVQNLKQIHYYLNPGVERLLGEIGDLYGLMQRLPNVELVKLHFSVVDGWASRFGTKEPEAEVLDRERWKRMLTGLLDVIVEKECRELHVTSGSRIRDLYGTKEDESVDGAVQVTARPAEASDVQTQETQAMLQNLLESDRRNRKRRSRFFKSWSLSGIFRRMTLSEPKVNLSQIVQPLPSPEIQDKVQPQPIEDEVSVVETVILPQPEPPKTSSKLRDVYIHSDMLLQPTFYSWTVSTLSIAASTLTRLSFRCGEIKTPTWATLLKALDLPKVTHFEICTDLVVSLKGAAFTDLEDFLGRHPTITSLHLHGVETNTTGQPPSKIKKPILPNLTTLMAHPTWVISLLGMLDDQQEEIEPPLKDLRCIGISTEYYQYNDEFDYTLIDDALKRVATFPTSDITLTLRFMCQPGVAEWFASHVALGTDADGVTINTNSVLSSLQCVSTLVVSSAFFVDFKQHTIDIVPEWLSLFPKVQHVKFIEQPEEQAQRFRKPLFLEKLVSLCPGLKTIEVYRKIIDLDEMRDGASESAVLCEVKSIPNVVA